MTLGEVGQSLRAEREKKGLRIEDVAAKLKISPRLLYALEAGDNAALPHAAYVRGFIRSYAGLLGLSHEEVQTWMNDLGSPVTGKAAEGKAAPAKAPERKTPEARPMEAVVPDGDAPLQPPSDASNPPPHAPEPQLTLNSGRPAAKKGSGKWIVALCILAAAVACLWWAWQSGKLEFLRSEPVKAAMDLDQRLPQADAYLAARDAANQAAAEESRPVPESAPAPGGGASQGMAQSAGTPPPASPEATGRPQADLALPPDDLPPRAPEEKATEPESHKLIITAVEECWVHSNADRTDTRQFSLRKGDVFALTFHKSLELKLGNAGGVRLRYDGEELPPPGTSGQVRTITFPPASR